MRLSGSLFTGLFPELFPIRVLSPRVVVRHAVLHFLEERWELRVALRHVLWSGIAPIVLTYSLVTVT